MEQITGQLIFRDVGQPPYEMEKGTKLMMVFGIIKVPENTPLKGEHQYIVTGKEKPEHEVTGLVIHQLHGQDVSNVTEGQAPTGILRSPIWRV